MTTKEKTDLVIEREHTDRSARQMKGLVEAMARYIEQNAETWTIIAESQAAAEWPGLRQVATLSADHSRQYATAKLADLAAIEATNA